jgi:hypothetical protein
MRRIESVRRSAKRLYGFLSFELVEGGCKVPGKIVRASGGGVIGIAFSDNAMVRSQIKRALETDPWRAAMRGRQPREEPEQRERAVA